MAVTVQQLLAALALDAAQAVQVSDRFVMILRDPQEGDVGTPSAGTIYLRVVDLDGAPADPSAIDFRVYVDLGAGEVLAYDGTTPVAPWAGALAAADASDGADFYCWKDVRLDQGPAVFASDLLVTVRVEITVSVGGWGHADWGHFAWGYTPVLPITDSVTYTFTAEDTARPSLLAALAVGPRTVRVTFDDAMASGAGNVSDPAAWTFTRNNVDPYPAVTMTCTAVEAVDATATVWDLTTNWAMTIDGPYTVDVAATATDDAGNLVDVRAAAFVGFAPDAPPTRAFDYWRLCVPAKNKAEDATRDLERFARVVNETLSYLFAQVDHWVDEYDPDRCSDASIDAMLEDAGNPFTWSELDLTANQRRKLLRVLVDIYKLKGTAPGIENVIYFLLGKTVTVVPYTIEGWTLGVDLLGEEETAWVAGDTVEPFDLSAVPLAFAVTTEAGPSAMTLLTTDFADPSIATAQEVADAITARLSGCQAEVVTRGVPAVALALAAEPYAVNAGDGLELTVNGAPCSVVMHAADMAAPGAATAAEVAARITLDVPDVVAVDDGGVVRVTTGLRGMTASIAVVSGDMMLPLGWAPGDDWLGADGPCVAVYSISPSTDAEITVTAGAAALVLGLVGATAGVGSAILAPSTQATLYTFDLETATTLTADEVTVARRVAEYMKPAHTHLANVRLAPTLPAPNEWILGFGTLDYDSMLGQVLG
jgi:phage tail-like protein